MLRQVGITISYFLILTLGAIFAGELIKFIILLTKWIGMAIFDGIRWANYIIAEQQKHMVGTNFSSELFEYALYGWSLWIFSVVYRLFNGYWPHE